MPERHQATVAICVNKCMKIAIGNVRKLFQSGILESVKQEMTRIGINILSISETGWKNNCDFTDDEYGMILSGGDYHRRRAGLLLDKEHAKCVHGYWQLAERALLVRLEGKPVHLAIIVAYVPTSDSEEK